MEDEEYTDIDWLHDESWKGKLKRFSVRLNWRIMAMRLRVGAAIREWITPQYYKRAHLEIHRYCQYHGITPTFSHDIHGSVWVLSNKAYTLNNALVRACKSIAKRAGRPDEWPRVYGYLITLQDPFEHPDSWQFYGKDLEPYIMGSFTREFEEYRAWKKAHYPEATQEGVGE